MDWGLLEKVAIIASIVVSLLMFSGWLAKKTLAIDKWLDSQRLLRKQKRRIIEEELFLGRLNKFFNKKKNTILNEALRASDNYKYEEAISKFRLLYTLFTEPIERIAILNQIGLNQIAMCDFKAAKETFTKMAEEAEKNKQTKALSIALGNAGIAARELGELEESRDLHFRAFQIAEELGYNSGEAKQYGNMATAYEIMGNQEEALELYGKSLKISQETGDYRGVLTALCGIGLIYRTKGESKQAMEFLQQSYEVAKRHGDEEVQAIVLNDIGVMFKEQVKGHIITSPAELRVLDKAMGYFEKALKVIKKIRNPKLQADVLTNIGNVYRLQQKYKEALDSFRLALVLAKQVGARITEAGILGSFGNFYAIQERWKDSLNCHKESLEICMTIGYREGEGKALGNIGLMYMFLGEFTSARFNIRKAREIFKEMGSQYNVAIANHNLEILDRVEKEKEQN